MPSTHPDYTGAPEFDLRGVLGDDEYGAFTFRVLDGDGDGMPASQPQAGRAGAASRASVAADELWIIQKFTPRAAAQAAADDDFPASGSLFCPPAADAPAGSQIVPVPLRHTDVKASITGYISTVNVTQQFTNPFDSKIEAVYVFPLPENSAVSEFLMTVGTRTIRGIIREREEAAQIYAAAKRQGYTASLLTQERPNIFTQRVANIEPGHDIDITIKYYSTLAYSDGAYHFVFPMVVGPRFNPPGTASAVTANGQGSMLAPARSETAVTYLRPSQRSGHDISIAMEIDAGVPIERISSPTHELRVNNRPGGGASVTLAASATIPNRDFIVSYRVASDDVKSSLITHRDARGGYFTLMIVPPASLKKLDRSPVEMVFVIDCSGSMNGRPMEQAKDAVRRGLRNLDDDDTFQIIDFSSSVSTLGEEPLRATRDNLKRAERYLDGITANGGTYMVPGMRAALNFKHDSRRLRFVAFLTDGFIGNEAEILTELALGADRSRVFGMGVGSAPNRWLMDEMSVLGRGAVSYVGLEDDAGAVMDSFFATIAHPAMMDISIEWGNAVVSDVYPTRLPDLFVGRPVIVTGRYEGQFAMPVRVKGRAAGRNRDIAINPCTCSNTDRTAAIPQIWARTKIADTTRVAFRGGARTAEDSIRRIALEYGLMSEFTSFVAVDSLTRTEGSFGTTVPVAVPVPTGVRYETSVR